MPKLFNVGIKAVIVRDRQALLLKSKTTSLPVRDFWDLPGGRIDGDESIEQALERELHEELPSIKNFTIKRLLSAWRLNEDFPDGTGIVLIFYQIETVLQEVKLSSEHSEHRWVGPDEVDKLETVSGVEFPEGYKQAVKLALK